MEDAAMESAATYLTDLADDFSPSRGIDEPNDGGSMPGNELTGEASTWQDMQAAAGLHDAPVK